MSNDSDSDSDKVELVSYSSVFQVDNSYLETTKISDDHKKGTLSMSHAVQPIAEDIDVGEIKGLLNAISILYQVTPGDMAKEQHRDPILRLVCPYIIARDKIKSSTIPKIKSKVIRKYLLQFDTHMQSSTALIVHQQ